MKARWRATKAKNCIIIYSTTNNKNIQFTKLILNGASDRSTAERTSGDEVVDAFLADAFVRSKKKKKTKNKKP
jgi:hypothetical protein